MKIFKSPRGRLALFGLLCFLLILASQISWDRSYRTASGIPRSYAPFGDEVRREDGSVDYRATLNQLLGEPLPPEKNAAVVFATLVGEAHRFDPDYRALLFKAIGLNKIEYATGQQFFDGYTQADKENPNSFELIWQSDQDYPVMAAWLDRYPEQLGQLRAACHLTWYVPLLYPNAASLLASDLLPLINSPDAGARILLSDAYREAGRGNLDAAVADVIAVDQLALNFSGPMAPLDNVALKVRQRGISGAEKLMQQFALTEEQLKALADSFRQEGLPQLFQPSRGRGDRYMLLEALQEVERKQFSSETQDQSSRFFIPTFGYGAFTDRGTVLQYLNLRYDQLQGISELQGRALAETLKSFSLSCNPAALPWGVKGTEELDVSFWFGIMLSPTIRGQRLAGVISSFDPSVYFYISLTVRTFQKRRLLELAIALERYQRDNRSYPDALERLVPEFLDKLPIDQFVEKGSFRYERLDDGFRVFAHPDRPALAIRMEDIPFEIVVDRAKQKLVETAK
jgi:hypothetical protein